MVEQTGKRFLNGVRGKKKQVARWLHIYLPSKAVAAVLAVAAFVLWQPAGCVIPPPEPGDDGVNLPPVLYWDLAVPSDYQLEKFTGETQQLDFSVEGAVLDPEGDDLGYLWLTWTSNNDKAVHFGKTNMSLLPCDSAALKGADWVMVMVAVSDRPLDWDPSSPDAIPVKAEALDGETEEEAQNRIAIRSWYFEVAKIPSCGE